MTEVFTSDQDEFLDWVYDRFRETGRWPTLVAADMARRSTASPAKVVAELTPAFIASDGTGPDATWQLTLRGIESRRGSEVDLRNLLAAVRYTAATVIEVGGPVSISSADLERRVAIPRLEADRVTEIIKREQDLIGSFTTPPPPARTSYTPGRLAARFEGIAIMGEYWYTCARGGRRPPETRRERLSLRSHPIFN